MSFVVEVFGFFFSFFLLKHLYEPLNSRVCLSKCLADRKHNCRFGGTFLHLRLTLVQPLLVKL